jgi:hypothetical protein
VAQEREELFDLYRIAIDEYRFEVKLNTDRMIHYIVFNSALLSAGAGLVKIAADPILDAFVATIFLLGIFTTWLGRRAIKKGHEYYQRTRYKKTLIEDLLGLHQPVTNYPGATLAISTTHGQQRVQQMLDRPDGMQGPPSKTSITRAGIMVLWLLTTANAIGSIVAVAPLLVPLLRR